MNSCFIVGNIEKMPQDPRCDNENGYMMQIRCTRPYAEPNGVFLDDVFPVELWRGIAADTCSICRTGDPIAIKGRLIIRQGMSVIIAEHVSLPNQF